MRQKKAPFDFYILSPLQEKILLKFDDIVLQST